MQGVLHVLMGAGRGGLSSQLHESAYKVRGHAGGLTCTNGGREGGSQRLSSQLHESAYNVRGPGGGGGGGGGLTKLSCSFKGMSGSWFTYRRCMS